MSATMHDLIAAIDSRLDLLSGALNDLDHVRGHFRARGGLATATVDGNGRLVAFDLAEKALKFSPEDVATLITWTCAQAAKAAASQRAQIMSTIDSHLRPAS